MPNMSSLELQHFFPAELSIRAVEETPEQVIIHLKSQSKTCTCPGCGCVLHRKHSTYLRRVQDLPILGKNVELQISAYAYTCDEEACSTVSVNENFSGFLGKYSRMTDRCEDFVVSLALETSCEGTSRVLSEMGIRISGDSIIRLLLRRFQEMPEPACGSIVGVDDFAYKKRHTYCTVVVEEATHKTVAVLDGRDGSGLKEWLAGNKHIKAVTRDRASTYARVLQEELPDAIQIADRFHIHQNLLEAIKKALDAEIPVNVPLECSPADIQNEDCKKRAVRDGKFQ